MPTQAAQAAVNTATSEDAFHFSDANQAGVGHVAVGYNAFFMMKKEIGENGMPTWEHKQPSIEQQMSDVVWAGDRFVAVGYGSRVATSVDGNVWVIGTPLTNKRWVNAAFSESLNVLVVIASDGTIARSADRGVTFVETASGHTGGAIGWSPSRNSFVAQVDVANGDFGALESTDGGLNWVEL